MNLQEKINNVYIIAGVMLFFLVCFPDWCHICKCGIRERNNENQPNSEQSSSNTRPLIQTELQLDTSVL